MSAHGATSDGRFEALLHTLTCQPTWRRQRRAHKATWTSPPLSAVPS